MPYEAGTAVLEIAPSFLNVEQMIAKAARDLAKGLDKELGSKLGSAMQNAAKSAEKDASRSGEALGRAFAERAMAKVGSALANISKNDNVLKPLREELEAISQIDLGKGFDERAFIQRIERAYSALKKAQQDANGINAVGRYTNAGNAAAELGAVKDIVEAARRRGFAAGDAYANAYQSRLKAMDLALPDLKTRAASSPDERRAAALKQRIQDAQKVAIGDTVTSDNNPLNLKIGVKVSEADLAREMGMLEGLLDQFAEQTSQVELGIAADKASQQAGAFFSDIETRAEKAAQAQAASYLKAMEEAYKQQALRDRKYREDMAKAFEDAQAEDHKRRKKALADLAKMYDDAVAEDYKREKKKAEEFLRLWDDAVKEQYKRDQRARQDLAKAHEDAIGEDFKRQRRAAEDFSRLWDQAQLEQYKRDLRNRNDFSKAYDDAIAEDFKRQRRRQDDFLAQWDDAIKEQYKRELKARNDFSRMYDDAIAEDYRRRRKADDDYNRDYRAAVAENARRNAEMLRGTTAGRAQAGTRKAAGALPDIPVGVRTNQVDRDLADIRARVRALGDLTIGINVDAAGFANQVEREFRRLETIAKDKKVSIEVRTDAARAASELGDVLVQLGRIESSRANVRVDTDEANTGLREMLGNLTLNLGRLGAVIALGASLGTAIVPAAAAAASAIGAIGTAALAGGVGLGVMMLAFSGIGEAVGLMDKAAKEQAKTNKSLTRAGNQVAGALDQIESAEMALANTRRTNARAAIKAQRAIRDAVEDQRDAVRDAARDMRDANERVADAQRDLSDAESDSRRTRERLNDAYRAAQRAIDDLNSSVRGNALDQRQATLDIAEAKEELDKALTNPRATEAEREQAAVTYEQRKLQMEDLQRKGAEMSDEQEKRFAVGLKGSEEVKRAEEAILEANERTTDAQRALARAQRDRDETRLDGLEKIRDAQQKVADAQQAAADQQADAAYALFTANQNLASAQRGLANATVSSATAGSAALDNLRNKLADMTPEGRKFAAYIYGLKDAFKALKTAADPVLHGLRLAMINLIGGTSEEAKVKLKPLFDFINRVATAIGGMFIRLSQTLKGPTFTRFFKYISDTAVPTLEKMYTAFENILVGVTNLFLAFTPLTGDVEDGFVGMTEKFREWSEGLEENKGFQSFLTYLRDSGPKVAHLLGQIVKSVVKLIEASAPVGSTVVDLFTKLFTAINKIPEKTLIALVSGIAAAAAALAVFAGVTALVSLSVPGLIAGGIALLVVAFAALVGSSKDLREKLAVVWEEVKKGAVVAFGLLKKAIVAMRPVFDGMIDAALSFYNDGIKPAFEAIKALIVGVIDGIRPYFGSIQGTFLKLAGIAMFLYTEAIVPAFKGIMAVVGHLFKVIKPTFSAIGTVIGALGGFVFWLLDKVFLPVIGFIVKLLVKTLGPTFEFLWKYVLKPILNKIGLGFQITSALIKVAVGIIIAIIKAFGAGFRALYDWVIKPIWDKLVKYVFRPMAEWFEKHIQPRWEKAVKKLGDIWAGLKKMLGVPVKFIVETLLNNGLLKGYNKLADAFNITPKNVKIDPPPGGWSGFATGGAVYGPGTGTSDSIPAWLSRGEHVLTAREVAAAGGHDAIYALRRAIIKGSLYPGYARGGEVGRRPGTGDGFGDWLKKLGKSAKDKATDVFDSTAAFLRDPMGSLSKIAMALLDKLPGKETWIVKKLTAIPVQVLEALKSKVKGLFMSEGGGQDGASSGAVFSNSNSLGGSGGMIRVLRAIFPGLNLNSGNRPGAITVTGNRSYHSRNRAVDVPPRRDVFEWIRANYPNSRELIFSPMGNRQIWNGRSHVYTGAVKRTHYCVPMDTEILTRRGWLTWDQLEVGDETPGLNFETGRTEWTRVTGAVQYDNAPLIEARSHSWTVRTTGGHRWVARDPLTGKFYWNTMDGEVEGTNQPARRRHKHQHSWVIAAPMADGPGLHLGLQEAELLGWLLAEGSQHDGTHHRGVNFSVHVWQTKPDGVERLKALLGDRASWNGKGFRLRNAYARDLMGRSGLTHIRDSAELLAMCAQMTAAQRAAMLTGVIGGDGTTWQSAMDLTPKSRIMQDEGPILEVITTLAYLCGHRTTVSKHKCSSGCWKHNGNPLMVNLGKPVVSTYNQGRTEVGLAPVWCPTTELGSWTARFGHNVVLTGNSHVHWAYDRGGELPDTRNMPGGVMQVFHGRRTPDKVLTDNQWNSMSVLANKARQSMTGGDTWNFDFKDTTLDESRLLAIQARRDALSRLNRRNY